MTIDIDELAKLEREATSAPWAVRPQEFDDWGYIRAADGYAVADTCKNFRYTQEEAAQCRRDGTQPAQVEANAQFIAALRNAASGLIAKARRSDGLGAEVARLRAQLERCRAYTLEACKQSDGLPLPDVTSEKMAEWDEIADDVNEGYHLVPTEGWTDIAKALIARVRSMEAENARLRERLEVRDHSAMEPSER